MITPDRMNLFHKERFQGSFVAICWHFGFLVDLTWRPTDFCSVDDDDDDDADNGCDDNDCDLESQFKDGSWRQRLIKVFASNNPSPARPRNCGEHFTDTFHRIFWDIFTDFRIDSEYFKMFWFWVDIFVYIPANRQHAYILTSLDVFCNFTFTQWCF